MVIIIIKLICIFIIFIIFVVPFFSEVLTSLNAQYTMTDDSVECRNCLILKNCII